MANEVTKIRIAGTWYPVKDASARNSIESLQSDVQSLQTNKASLASPAFSGTPTAPTPAEGDDSTKLATTEFVQEAVAGASGVPDGGQTGQVLAKASNDDGDAVWCWPGQYPTDKWYLPEGIQESQVLAAYQFVNRESEAQALININEGTEYALTKNGNVTWNINTGFYIPAEINAGLVNTDLQALYAGIFSAAFGFTDAAHGTGNFTVGGIHLHNYRTLVLKFSGGLNQGITYYDVPGINNKADQSYWRQTPLAVSANGVIAGNWNASESEVYIDGISQSLTTPGQSTLNTNKYNSFGIICQASDSSNMYVRSFYVPAVVFYNTQLSAAQQLELAENISALMED